MVDNDNRSNSIKKNLKLSVNIHVFPTLVIIFSVSLLSFFLYLFIYFLFFSVQIYLDVRYRITVIDAKSRINKMSSSFGWIRLRSLSINFLS